MDQALQSSHLSVCAALMIAMGTHTQVYGRWRACSTNTAMTSPPSVRIRMGSSDNRSASPSFVSPSQCLALRQPVYFSSFCQSLTVSCTETIGLPLQLLSVPHSVLHCDSRSTSPAFVSPSQCLALRQLVSVNLSVTFYQDNVSLSPAFRESVRVQIIVIHSYRDTSPSLSSDSLRVQIIVIHSYRDTSPSLSPAVRA